MHRRNFAREFKLEATFHSVREARRPKGSCRNPRVSRRNRYRYTNRAGKCGSRCYLQTLTGLRRAPVDTREAGTTDGAHHFRSK